MTYTNPTILPSTQLVIKLKTAKTGFVSTGKKSNNEVIQQELVYKQYWT